MLLQATQMASESASEKILSSKNNFILPLAKTVLFLFLSPCNLLLPIF